MMFVIEVVFCVIDSIGAHQVLLGHTGIVTR
jgi:hypothetical protein